MATATTKGKQDTKASPNGAKAQANGAPPAGQIDIDGQTVKAPDPPIEEIRVDGTAQLGMFDLGGKQAQSSALRLTGGKFLTIDGKAYAKGDVIHFEGTAVVNFVGQQDKHDPKTGIVVSAEQQHRARITDLTVKGAK